MEEYEEKCIYVNAETILGNLFYVKNWISMQDIGTYCKILELIFNRIRPDYKVWINVNSTEISNVIYNHSGKDGWRHPMYDFYCYYDYNPKKVGLFTYNGKFKYCYGEDVYDAFFEANKIFKEKSELDDNAIRIIDDFKIALSKIKEYCDKIHSNDYLNCDDCTIYDLCDRISKNNTISDECDRILKK